MPFPLCFWVRGWVSLGMCGLRSGRFGALPMCLLALGLAFGAQPWWLLSALFVQPLFSESSPLIPLVGLEMLPLRELLAN